MWTRRLAAMAVLSLGLAAQRGAPPLDVLPAAGAAQLIQSLTAAAAHSQHVWRDTPPFRDNGTVNAYVEISRGDRRKWEFDMRANRRAIDRVMPADIGSYPVNYGFVPQTVSYDGDPFDALVLGPPVPAGRIVAGVIVGLMYMEDETGIDSKVVLSPTSRDGRPLHPLTDAVRLDLANYFNKYKRGQPGKFSKVPGWGSITEGRAHITTTHAFFKECRRVAGAPCQIGR